jgi:hypothetical protein
MIAVVTPAVVDPALKADVDALASFGLRLRAAF